MYKLTTLPLFFGLFAGTLLQQDENSIENVIKKLFPKSTADTNNTDSSKCECVPFYLCNNDTTINTKGIGIIDIRAGGDCLSYIDLCCFPPDIRSTPRVPDTSSSNNRTGCGWRNPEGVAFETTGDNNDEAKFGEFPWMVAVLTEQALEGTLDTYQCGGSLIHPQAVITSAHCVFNEMRKYKIRAGEWDAQIEKEILPYQQRNVKSITIHPEYYGGALFNDIAFLLLESPLDLAGNVGMVCLPPQGTVIPSGTRCFASGWGKDQFGEEGAYQVILKKIELPIVDRDTCQTNLRTTRLSKYFVLHESFVCAGGESGIDTCKGDGGSPLVCPIPGQEGRYQQAGIVAWGIGCGESQIPGVYANVALFRNWVNDEIIFHKLNTTTYEY